MTTNLGTGKLSGFPVFTGQISDNKNKDFVFYDADETKTFSVRDVCKRAWRDFLFIHGDDIDDKSMSWPGHWKNVFYSGGKVPVFYLENQRRVQIALAFLPKLAGDFSVHDTIRHGGRDHTDDDFTDMTELLFGRVSDTPETAIKSRVWFEMATSQNDAKPVQLGPTILNGPKASYFPHYIEQDSVRRSDGQYATYMTTTKNPRPVARGWKRYPVRDDYEIQKLNANQVKNKKVQVTLNPLDKGASFRSRVVFHNLTPVELGALLWSMTFGGDTACRHGLGMGKPFGLGRIELEIAQGSFQCVPNDADSDFSNYSVADYIGHYEGYVNGRLADMSLLETPQIRSLKAMANPTSEDRKFSGSLRHMTLDMKYNEFLKAKQRGGILENILGETRFEAIKFSAAPELEAAEQPTVGGAGSEANLIAALEDAYEERLKTKDQSPSGPMISLREQLLEVAQEWESAEMKRQAAEVIRKTVKLKAWAKKRKAACSELLVKLEKDS